MIVGEFDYVRQFHRIVNEKRVAYTLYARHVFYVHPQSAALCYAVTQQSISECTEQSHRRIAYVGFYGEVFFVCLDVTYCFAYVAIWLAHERGTVACSTFCYQAVVYLHSVYLRRYTHYLRSCTRLTRFERYPQHIVAERQSVYAGSVVVAQVGSTPTFGHRVVVENRYIGNYIPFYVLYSYCFQYRTPSGQKVGVFQIMRTQ